MEVEDIGERKRERDVVHQDQNEQEEVAQRTDPLAGAIAVCAQRPPWTDEYTG